MNTYMIPVSIKGIVIEDGKVWLRKNEREEWEVPGGKLEAGEQPEETVLREMREELGYEVLVKDILQARLYTVENSIDESNGVLVVTYLCEAVQRVGEMELIGEGGRASFKKFAPHELDDLSIPDFYKAAVLKAFSKES